MKKRFQQLFQRYMIRPMIYQGFTRLVFGLTAALLWNEFSNISSVRFPLGYAFTVVGIFFGLCAWMAYLRLDGVKAPKFDRKLFQRKKTPVISYGDMSDHMDDEPVAYQELEDDEKDLCLLLSNLAVCILFLILSVTVG